MVLGGVGLASVSNADEEPNEWYVDDDAYPFRDGSAEHPFETISQAINNAEEGDTIYVFGGTYESDLVIDKRVKLWGGVDETISFIDVKTDVRYAVEIVADYVTFNNFSIVDTDAIMSSPIAAMVAVKGQNDVVQNINVSSSRAYGIYVGLGGEGNFLIDNKISNCSKGIVIVESDTNDMVGNKIFECSEAGIFVEQSDNVRFLENEIYRCSNAIDISKSNYFEISNNTISNNSYYGVYLGSLSNGNIHGNLISDNDNDGVYSTYFVGFIYNNTFDANRRGVTLNAGLCSVFENVFSNCSASGLYAQSLSSQNTIYENRFVDNVVGAFDEGDNMWYRDGRGNFWSDYAEVDRDLDGIGDVAYDKNGVVDVYPLGLFLKPPEVPSDPSPGDLEDDVGLRFTLSVEIEDPDSDLLTVSFYRAEDDSLIGVDRRVPAGSTARLTHQLGFDTAFAWYVVVNDSRLENRSNPWLFTTKAAPPDNVPPIADPGGPYEAIINDSVMLDGSGSVDPDGEVVLFRWNFGDGTSIIGEAQESHVYEQTGSYTVTLTVIDDSRGSDTRSTLVLVGSGENQNIAPVAVISAISSAVAGESVVFDGLSSFDEDGEIVEYVWGFGDGGSAIGENVSHSFDEAGSFLVSLTVTDDAEESDSATLVIAVEEKGLPGFELFGVVAALGVVFLCVSLKKKEKKR